MIKENEGNKYEQEQPESERKFSQEQYDILLSCSKNKSTAEWNEWRKQNLGEAILLEGADFTGENLHHVDLSDYSGIALDSQVFLKGALFERANLEHGQFIDADLRDADFTEANMTNTKLLRARLENTTFFGARLSGRHAAHNFYFRGACFDGAQLQGANLSRTITDSSTSFWDCTLDRDTDFRDMALEIVQMEQGKKGLLRYNIRRKNWEDLYQKHTWIKWLVKPFWLMSDYGYSTWRIIITFFVLASLFGQIYYWWAVIAPPGIVSNLLVDERGFAVPWQLVSFRALYFSIVTMTTLGFGDMYAKSQSFYGYLFLMVQVILGYVVLGALITRFAILFTAEGPVGTFAKKETLKPITEVK